MKVKKSDIQRIIVEEVTKFIQEQDPLAGPTAAPIADPLAGPTAAPDEDPLAGPTAAPDAAADIVPLTRRVVKIEKALMDLVARLKAAANSK
jgi:hypothetical protein